MYIEHWLMYIEDKAINKKSSEEAFIELKLCKRYNEIIVL